jgi:transcriptional regulator with XRE-family HTH domain
MALRSEGRRLLLVLLQTTTQSVVASKLGVSQPSVSGWAAGHDLPSYPGPRKALAREFGIHVDAWNQPPVAEHDAAAAA